MRLSQLGGESPTSKKAQRSAKLALQKQDSLQKMALIESQAFASSDQVVTAAL